MNYYLLLTVALLCTAHITGMDKSLTADYKLINAITAGKETRALELISQGIQVNTQDINGWTALMQAARRGYVEITKVLIAAGAHVNVQNNFGGTALAGAAKNGHIALVKALIAAGAHLNTRDGLGWTALIDATLEGHTEIIKMLTAAGANVNAQDYNGQTALMNAAYHGRAEVIKVLVALDADVNAENNNGWTALMNAAKGGHIEVIKILVAAGAYVNAKNNRGQTVLMYAATGGHPQASKILIAAGAACNKILQGYTEHVAFQRLIQGCFAWARDLSSTGNDSSTSSNKYFTCLRISTGEKLRRINNALITAHNVHVDCIDPEGNTLLHYLVLSGNRVAISLILYWMMKHNQFYALEHCDKQLGMTPIQMAVIKGGGRLLYPFFNLHMLKNK